MNLNNILLGLIIFLISLMMFIQDKPRSWREMKTGPPNLSNLRIKEGYWLGLIAGVILILDGIFS